MATQTHRSTRRESRLKGSPEGHASVEMKLATLGPPGGFLLVEAVGRQGDRLQIISCTTM